MYIRSKGVSKSVEKCVSDVQCVAPSSADVFSSSMVSAASLFLRQPDIGEREGVSQSVSEFKPQSYCNKSNCTIFCSLYMYHHYSYVSCSLLTVRTVRPRRGSGLEKGRDPRAPHAVRDAYSIMIPTRVRVLWNTLCAQKDRSDMLENKPSRCVVCDSGMFV